MLKIKSEEKMQGAMNKKVNKTITKEYKFQTLLKIQSHAHCVKIA